MSTFDGIIREVPEIRVDFFRGIQDNPPFACFLSHIHSDHLAGLDTYKGRPIYCSAATKAMLLKLQRHSSRINFHQGLLEKEEITYKHQRRRLKSLPLETPIEIELEPGNIIRVTLFDANHCPGAVMFLFEKKNKAVLYTGDIRSEPWHINAFVRSPCMIEYASGLKALDRVYLDTSFTEDVDFQTKAEGLHELIEKVTKYPKDTVFHFSAWTYGYEEVWIALAKTLNSQIHVDDYKLNVYRALQVKVEDDQYLHLSPEAPALTGFVCGNQFQPGILTSDETVRLHSCEKGTRCSKMAQGGVVFITPIVAHLSTASDMAEVGIGGGAGDLEQNDELILSPEDAQILFHRVCENQDLPRDIRSSLPDFLLSATSAQHPVTVNFPRSGDDSQEDDGNRSTDLQRALRFLAQVSQRGRGKESAGELPNNINFPYSRHSSYRETCHLLQVLRPKDVWPCTVDSVRWTREGINIKGLFGDYCTGGVFEYDEQMAKSRAPLHIKDPVYHNSQDSAESAVEEETMAPGVQFQAESEEAPAPADNLTSSQVVPASMSSAAREVQGRSEGNESASHGAAVHAGPVIDLITLGNPDDAQETIAQRRFSPEKRTLGYFLEQEPPAIEDHLLGEHTFEVGGIHGTTHLLDSQESSASAVALEARRMAFNAMMETASMSGWPGLISTTNNHTRPESELGEG